MDRALIIEWLAAEGIVTYRSYKADGHLPLPGRLLATSGVFVLLALLAEAGPGARQLAVTLGGGFVIAAGFGIAQNLGQPKAPATGAAKTGAVTA